jgi:hypothetical protein
MGHLLDLTWRKKWCGRLIRGVRKCATSRHEFEFEPFSFVDVRGDPSSGAPFAPLVCAPLSCPYLCLLQRWEKGQRYAFPFLSPRPPLADMGLHSTTRDKPRKKIVPTPNRVPLSPLHEWGPRRKRPHLCTNRAQHEWGTAQTGCRSHAGGIPPPPPFPPLTHEHGLWKPPFCPLCGVREGMCPSLCPRPRLWCPPRTPPPPFCALPPRLGTRFVPESRRGMAHPFTPAHPV